MRFLAILLALAPGLARAQFIGPTGMDSMPFASPPDFSFTAPAAGSYATLTAATGQTITCTRASTTTVLTSASALANVASGVCAVDYRGLQVEGATTNLALRSGDLSNAAWSTLNTIAVTANSCAFLDGATTMAKLDATASGSAVNERFQTVTLPATVGPFAASAWISPIDASDAVEVDGFNGGGAASIASCTCACSCVDGTNCSCTATATGGTDCTALATLTKTCRLSATWTSTTTTHTSPNIGVIPGDGTVKTKVCAGGAQIEAQAFPTSYVATLGTTAARAADNVHFTKPGNVSITGTKTYSAATVVQAEGVVANARTLGSNANFAPVFSLSSGVNNLAAFSDTTGGASQLTFADSSKTTSQRYQMHANGTKLFACAAGTCDATGYTLLTQPAEPTTLFLGSQDGTQFFLFGWISAACVAASATGCSP